MNFALTGMSSCARAAAPPRPVHHQQDGTTAQGEAAVFTTSPTSRVSAEIASSAATSK